MAVGPDPDPFSTWLLLHSGMFLLRKSGLNLMLLSVAPGAGGGGYLHLETCLHSSPQPGAHHICPQGASDICFSVLSLLRVTVPETFPQSKWGKWHRAGTLTHRTKRKKKVGRARSGKPGLA